MLPPLNRTFGSSDAPDNSSKMISNEKDVHLVAYVSLKEERWIRARNLIIAFFWLLCILAIVGASEYDSENYTVLYALAVFQLFLILLFSLCVLKVLICSGPGEGNGRRHHVDQSRLRAFYFQRAGSAGVKAELECHSRFFFCFCQVNERVIIVCSCCSHTGWVCPAA